jgi:SAM-dependent methyltransferase
MSGRYATAMPDCAVCGGREFSFNPVLWPELIQQWELSTAEAAYVDRQQGCCCSGCGSNLRSIALARAICSYLGTLRPLRNAVKSWSTRKLRVLELNEAGSLRRFLRQLPRHVAGDFPQVDMQKLPYPDAEFDLVIHSDTLEHVPDVLQGLRECRRVLKAGGALCFTVPTIVGRPTRSRAGMSPSYHGGPADRGHELLVHTEFGDDAWTWPLRAGFADVAVLSIDYPAALAYRASGTAPNPQGAD